MTKSIAMLAILTAAPALAAGASSDSPPPVEPQPPCTGAECRNVYLDVQNKCVWARNVERSPVVLVLTLANGTPAQFVLKSAIGYTAANAPYDNRQCDSLRKTVENMNKIGRGEDAISFVPELRKCHSDEMAARAANLEKDEFYDSGTRSVRRKSTIGLGGTFMSSEPYPIYWQRLKIGPACLNTLQVIKSYTAALQQPRETPPPR